jgi:hypothetical protein
MPIVVELVTVVPAIVVSPPSHLALHRVPNGVYP